MTAVPGRVNDIARLERLSEEVTYPDNVAEYGAGPTRIQAYRYAWDLYAAFAEVTGKPKPDFEPPPMPVVPRAHRRKQSRQNQKEHISIDPHEWKAVREVLKTAPGHEALVLRLLLATGLRIGDILRLEPEQLEAAQNRADGLMKIIVKGAKPVYTTVKGPPSVEWAQLTKALKAAKARNVAELICPKGGGDWKPASGAYQASRRAWQDACKKAKVTGEHNLHRIRRTVAVYVRRATGSLDVAQEMLGHESSRTTAIYTSEADIDMITRGLEALEKV